MSFIAVILGAVGAILSVFKSRWCFMVWIFPNAYWIWFNWPGIQSVVFVVMSASCVAGWIAWDLDAIGRRELVENCEIFRLGWTQAQSRNIQLRLGIIRTVNRYKAADVKLVKGEGFVRGSVAWAMNADLEQLLGWEKGRIESELRDEQCKINRKEIKVS